MRPALTGVHTPKDNSKTKAGDEHTLYENDRKIWPSEVDGKRNPWHKNVNDIMFYI